MSKCVKVSTLIICFVIIFSLLSACVVPTSPAETTKSEAATKSSETTKPAETKPKEKATIEWSTWGNPGESKIFEDFTAKFNERHTGSIETKFSLIPSSGYSQKILSSIAAGIAPDVFYIKAYDIIVFTKENRLLDIKPMMDASATAKPDVFALNIFGHAIQGDKIFGIVPDCNPLVIYYNADMIKGFGEKTPQELLDEGKWNRDALTRIAKKAAEAGKHGIVIDVDSSSQQHSLFLGDSGEGLYFDPAGTKVDLDNPAKAAGMKWIYELSQAKAVTEEVQFPKGQDQISLFASNQAAMVVLGRWGVPIFKDIKDFEWDIVPFPTTNDGKEVKPSVTISYICINAATKHKEASFTFVEEYCNKDGQTFRLKDGGNAIPSIDDPAFVNDIVNDGIVKHAEYFTQALKTGLSVPIGTQKSPEAASAVFDAMRQMFLGKINADQCIEQAKQKADPILAEANK